MLGIEKWRERLSDKIITVLGDFCRDRNNINKLSGRDSLEFDGVPIRYNQNPETEYAPGGAGNVVVNFNKLGVNVFPLGIIGTDFASLHLRNLLGKIGISTEDLIADDKRRTLTYEKFYTEGENGKPQTYRLDTPNKEPPSSASQEEILDILEVDVKKIDAFYIADQVPTDSFPSITPKLRANLGMLLSSCDRPAMVDSRERIRDWARRGFVLKPNEEEIQAFSFYDIKKFLSEHNLPFMYVTAHEKGVYLFQEEEQSLEPIRISTKSFPGDPTGCGDAFGAACLTALLVGETPLEAGRFGNAAAYHTIQQIGGCGMPTLQELFKNYKMIYEE